MRSVPVIKHLNRERRKNMESLSSYEKDMSDDIEDLLEEVEELSRVEDSEVEVEEEGFTIPIWVIVLALIGVYVFL